MRRNSPGYIWEADNLFDPDNQQHNDPRFLRKLLIYRPENALAIEKDPPKPPKDTSPYLATLYQFPLLTREGEWMLFMKMNYTKYLANEARDEMELYDRCKLLESRHRQMIAVAQDTRNFIAQHNLRLVFSIAVKYKRDGMTLDDFISNGNMTLLRTIDKFDPNRRNNHNSNYNKFSTYAAWSIINNYHRDIATPNQPHSDYPVDEMPIPHPASLDDNPDPLREDIAQLRQEIKRLRPREQVIVQSRYAIDTEQLTLEQIGVKLRISKERVRQIQVVAMRKLTERIAGVRLPHPKLKQRPYRRRSLVAV